MIRKAFLFHVRPGKASEYERRHNPIWQELHAELKAHGVHNYSIFLHEPTHQLFGYVEIEDEQRWQRLADSPVCHRWWREMTTLLVSDSPDAAKAREDELREVFHID